MSAGKKQCGKNAMAVINEHIKNESYAPVYLLYGDETYLVNQYRDKLLSAVTDREEYELCKVCRREDRPDGDHRLL